MGALTWPVHSRSAVSVFPVRWATRTKGIFFTSNTALAASVQGAPGTPAVRTSLRPLSDLAVSTSMYSAMASLLACFHPLILCDLVGVEHPYPGLINAAAGSGAL